jgi:hypothetical protein
MTEQYDVHSQTVKITVIIAGAELAPVGASMDLNVGFLRLAYGGSWSEMAGDAD